MNPTVILNLYNQSLSIFNDIDYLEGTGNSYKGLSELYIIVKEFDKAKEFALEFLKIGKLVNSKTQTRDAHLLLSTINEQQLNFKKH